MVTRRRSAYFFLAAGAAVAAGAGLSSALPAHAEQLCYQHTYEGPGTYDHAWADENGVTLYPYQPSWWGDHYGSLTVNGVRHDLPQPGVAYGPTPVEEFVVCKSNDALPTTTTAEETTTTAEETTTTAVTTTTAPATTTTVTRQGTAGATTTTLTASGAGGTTTSGSDGSLPVTGTTAAPLLATAAVLLASGVILLVRSRRLPA